MEVVPSEDKERIQDDENIWYPKSDGTGNVCNIGGQVEAGKQENDRNRRAQFALHQVHINLKNKPLPHSSFLLHYISQSTNKEPLFPNPVYNRQVTEKAESL